MPAAGQKKGDDGMFYYPELTKSPRTSPSKRRKRSDAHPRARPRTWRRQGPEVMRLRQEPMAVRPGDSAVHCANSRGCGR